MSTKALRAALLRLAEIDDGSAPGTLKALSELEAIERAAKDYWSDEAAHLSPEAHDVMESIARDAP